DSSCYRLSNLIHNALGIDLPYTMVRCKQQQGGWECGYLVIQHMFEFLRFYVDQFPIRVNTISSRAGN
ncbi:hypothetical protein M8C21_003014, partial [Ambrosia artemisiifolia]